MLTSEEVEGEGNLAVGEKIPSSSVKGVAVDGGDAEALPAEACGLPCETTWSPCGDGVKADEDQE